MDERHYDHRQNQQAPEVRGTPVTHPRCAGRGLRAYPVNETPESDNLRHLLWSL